MKMSDKPKVHGTLKDLEVENKPEPYVQALSGSKRITFPDILELEFREAEQFIADISDGSNSEVLKKWLSPEDYEALLEEGLTLRQISVLFEKVQAHYGGLAGSQGEGRA